MTSKGWLIPEPITGNGETCLQITIPDNRRYIAAVVGAIYQTGKWFNWETSGDLGDTRASETAAVMRRYIYDTLTVGDCPVNLSEVEQERTQSVFSGASAIDDLLDLMEQINVKYRIDGELYEPVIDLVKCGCGSGDGTGDASDGGGVVDGGSEGGNYEGLTRVIDICKNVQSIFLDQIDDWIDSAQLLQYVPGLNFLSEGLEEVLGVSLDELDAFEGEIDSVDFSDALKKWVVQRFDDPFPGFVDREQLRTLTARLPLTVGGTLFMPVIRVWAEVADIQRLNASIIAAKGTASLTGECAALQRGFGREPYNPVGGDNSVIVLEDENYKYTRIYAGEYGVNGDFTGTYTGTNYVGQLSKLTTVHTPDTGVGTALNQTIETTNTQGTVTETGGIGTGSAGTTAYQAGGQDDIGLTAAAAFPSYFAGWTDGNPQEPSGSTYPDTGSFSGSIDLSSGQNTSAKYELWIVTGLDGDVQKP